MRCFEIGEESFKNDMLFLLLLWFYLLLQRLKLRSSQTVRSVCDHFRRGGRELSVILLVSLLQLGTAVFPVPSSMGRSMGRTTTTAAAWFISATPASA